MKIITTGNAVKLITDTVELSSLYLNGSYEYDTKFGSINGSIAMDLEDYKGSELEGAINAGLQLSLEDSIKANQKFKTQIVSAEKAIKETNDLGESTGRILIKFKNKCKYEKDGELFDRTLKVLDTKRNPIIDYKTLTAGTKARLSLTMVPYYMASSKTSGVSLWLNAIMVIDPVWYDAGSSDFGSDDIEGFIAEVRADVASDEDILGALKDIDA